MWLEKRAVPRPLVVEGKALRLSANLDDARAAFQPAVIASGARQSRLDRRIATLLPMTVRGLERVLCERGKDVGEEQFLVLLLVVDSKFDEFKLGWAEGRERPKDRIIDMRFEGAVPVAGFSTIPRISVSRPSLFPGSITPYL